MKKFLLSALAVLASTASMSAEELTFDFTTNAYGQQVVTSGSDAMEDGTSFSDGVITITANTLEGSGVRFWATNTGAQTFRINKNSGITISINGGTITGLKITGSSFGYLQGEGYNDGTWEGSASSIALVNLGASGKTGTVQLKTMTVTYTGGTVDTRKEAGLAFAEDKATAVMGEAFTAPVLTKETNAAVTYTSDKESVATVDPATGVVTLVGKGKARITATAEENTEYKGGTASYLLTVLSAVPENAIFFSRLGEGFSFDNPAELEVWSLDKTYGLKGTAYINKQPNAAVAVAYTTEAIDLTGKEGIELNFSNAFNNYKLNNENIPTTDFKGYAFILIREEGATEWTELGEPTAPEKFSWDFYANAPVSLEAYAGKKVQIGFRYVSTAEVAGTWEVQEISVTGKQKTTAIEGIGADDANAPVEYFNIQGVRVDNPANGLFIRRQGNTVTKVIIK